MMRTHRATPLAGIVAGTAMLPERVDYRWRYHFSQQLDARRPAPARGTIPAQADSDSGLA